MTTFERFERAIPELMTELSPARVPDYFDERGWGAVADLDVDERGTAYSS